MIIGFQGIKNSYNDYATDEFIKRLKINIKKLPLTTSKCVARALLNKEIDLGVIALKNNIAGIVEESDKILKSNLFKIVDTIEMEISHCLFAFNESSAINPKIITSHPQALKQCEKYLKSNYPNCELQKYIDTAKTAEDLKSGFLNNRTLIICSEKAGKENGLYLVSKNIADNISRTTFGLIKLI